jgi:nicotinate-nucleotide pyrophosphorylase (carboxylating)
MPDTNLTALNPIVYEDLVRSTLKSDLGHAGDITTDSIVPARLPAVGKIICRQEGCLAGIDVSSLAFTLLDSSICIEKKYVDGSKLKPGDLIAELEGSARTILQAERTALNFLGHLSGVATATNKLVHQLEGLSTRVVCTRKTTPGLRALEKYAVRAGGGYNHRFGLDDAVLIKENHLAIAGSVEEAVRRVRRRCGHMVKVEVEVESVDQLREALRLEIDAVLLDNMTVEQVEKAVSIVDRRVIIEVSGGITSETVRALAETGVDLVSVGWLTHSAPSLDVSLLLDALV